MRPTNRYENLLFLTVFGTVLLWALWLYLSGGPIG